VSGATFRDAGGRPVRHDRDAIGRGLRHHAGRLRDFDAFPNPDGPDGPRPYRVTFGNGTVADLTVRESALVCHALASAIRTLHLSGDDAAAAARVDRARWAEVTR
jgi:hypothetical protein